MFPNRGATESRSKPTTARRAAATTACILFFIGIILVIGSFGGVAGSVNSQAADSLGDPTTTNSSAATNVSNVTVHSAVATGTGTQSVLVRFGPHQPSETMEAAAVETHLKARAESAEEPLQARAASTPGLEIEQSFWIANATLVSLNTTQVDPATVATVNGVSYVGPNPTVATLETTASSPIRGSKSSFLKPPLTLRPRFGINTVQPPVSAVPSILSNESEATEISEVQPTEIAPGSTGPATTSGVAQINTAGAWSQFGTRGGGTRVAVLDTGVDPSHPDLTVAGWAAFAANGTQLQVPPQDYDRDGHGTHVSGTVAGGANSGAYVGVAPATELFHAAVLTDCDSRCGGSLAQIFNGLQWAVERDVDVVTMSFGITGYVDMFVDPMYNVRRTGTTVVASAGNGGPGTTSSPGNTYDVISVGAVDTTGTVAGFSAGETITTEPTWGVAARSSWPTTYTVPTITAPGIDVGSTLPGGAYGVKSGTSMAAPHTAGSLALIQAATTSQLSPAELEAALRVSASKPDEASDGHDTRYGHGIIDVAAAAATAAGEPRFAVTVTNVTTPVAGTPMTVTAEITNVGAATDTQTVTATIPGVTSTTRSVTLAAGETTTIAFPLPTTNVDAGQYTVHLASDDAATTSAAQINQPATLAVNITATNAPVVAGDPLTTVVSVMNTGDVAADAPITFSVDRTQDGQFETIRTRQISPAPGETDLYELQYQTQLTDTPAIDLRVESNATNDIRRDARVIAPDAPETALRLTELSAPASVPARSQFNVTVTAENTASTTTTNTIRLRANATTLATTSVTVNGDATETIVFDAAAIEAPGSYNLTALTAVSSITQPITITEADSSLSRFDQEHTGRIDRSDVINAIIAFNANTRVGGETVSRNEVIDLIIAYNNETQVATR